jgi:hypothetical protein
MPASAIVIKLRANGCEREKCELYKCRVSPALAWCAKFSRRYLRRLTARRGAITLCCNGRTSRICVWCTRAHYQQQGRPLRMIGSWFFAIHSRTISRNAQFGLQFCDQIEPELRKNETHNSIWLSVHSTEHVLPKSDPLLTANSLCGIIWYRKQNSFHLLARQWPAKDPLMFIDASCC